jgi:hypothetical protein
LQAPLAGINSPNEGNASSFDRTGWTVHTCATADKLTGAAITVADLTIDAGMAVTTDLLGANYGSRQSTRFVLVGWTSQAGHEYAVNEMAPSLAWPTTWSKSSPCPSVFIRRRECRSSSR